MVNDYSDVHSVKSRLSSLTNGSLTVYTWEELNPELVQFIESD
jgi:hypothetical protein